MSFGCGGPLPKFCSLVIRIRYFNYNDIHIYKLFSLFFANKGGGGGVVFSILYYEEGSRSPPPRGPLSLKLCYNDFDVKITKFYTHEI